MSTPHVATGDWVLVRTAHGSYLGKVFAVAEGGVTLNPAYDYYANLVTTPDGRVQRQTVCLPFDNCVYPVAVSLRLADATIAVFTDMAEADKKKYEKLVDQAEKMSLAARANIQLPGVTGA